MLLIHGLGGSLHNWDPVLDQLAASHRVIAPNLVGFGSTEPLGRPATVDANRQMLERLIEHLGVGPVTVMGNSMGGLIAMLLASKAPDLVSGLVLVNPASPLPPRARISPGMIMRLVIPALPVVGPASFRTWMRAVPPEQQVADTLQFVAKYPERLPAEYVEVAVELARQRMDRIDWAPNTFAEAAQSIGRTLTNRSGFKAMVRHIMAPTLLVHGDSDQVVPPLAADYLAEIRTDWTYHVFSDTGHVPMIECPDEFLALVDSWMTANAIAA
ncbi:MAG: alpha/beta hydrolase, partial [Acidimicrobiia bacterium]|nr:alpha/beta hydrolase [Acidimicrobiia bacterium]